MAYRLAILLMLFIHNDAVAAATLTEQAAEDICQCLKEPYQQVQAIQATLKEAKDSGSLSRITDSQDDMMSVISAAKLCMEKVRSRYPDIHHSPEQQEAVLALTESRCPNPLSDTTNKPPAPK